MERTVAELAPAYAGRMRFVSVDVDQQQSIAERYAIRSLPTLLVLKAGHVVQQSVGAMPRAKLEALLQRVL